MKTRKLGKGKKILLIIGGVLVLLIIGIALFYFTVISPAFVSKPDIEKPSLEGIFNPDGSIKEGAQVTEEFIRYLANELGMYKLHNAPFDDEVPEIIYIVSDDNEVFDIKIIDNNPQVTKGDSDNADLKLTSSKEVVFRLIASEDIPSSALNMQKEGKIEIEPVNDLTTLGLKGYKAVYDSITSTSDHSS